MEISLLKALLNNISSFLHLSSIDNLSPDLVHKHYQKAEEILKLLKPILDAIVDSEIASDEVLTKAFNELGQSVDELRVLLENWQPLASKVYFVMQIESLISKIRTLGLDIFKLLKSSHQHLPDELSSSSLEYCAQKVKQMGYEQTSSIVREAIRDQAEGVGPSSEILVKIAESLSLWSNQDILIEAVALEKLKENAEHAEKPGEAELFDQMISLVTRMHDRLILIKQSQTHCPVPIPADFCCPLSLELMTDPVIVASGQTYERAFIKNWIELGLTVCPKTRQTLAHTNLIPNYTVKALIANWCESNNVKLPDPVKSVSFNQPSPPLIHAESGTPRDSHSRGNQPMSPESTRSTDSPRNRISSSGVHREGSSPLHPRSTSEGSLSEIVGSEQGLDMARISLTSSEERSTNLEERNMDSAVRHSLSPSVKEASNAVRANEPIAQSHSRNASASSAIASSNFSQGAQGDSNESSDVLNHLSSYSSDTSGEVKAETQASTALNSPRPHREPEFAPRLLETRSRSQTIWRRPSDRLVPRIVSSPAIETKTDLSGIETQVRKLVEDLKSDSIDVQKAATGDLRQLAKHNMENRIIISNCGAISILVDLLKSTDAKVQENAVTALLESALHQLEARKDASEERVQWVEIKQHFHNLDTMLKSKFKELETREKEYMEKEAETNALLAEREAAVAAKELDFLDRVQELKDAAVAIIAEARANHQPTMLDSIDGGDNKDSKVSSSLGETNSPEDSPHKMGENSESVAVDIKPRPELTQFCEQMDSKGLLSFTIENQKNLYALREELSIALESANEPAHLVLDSLEAFYPPVETSQPMDKKDAALQGMRKSCIMFMEAMAALLARTDPGADHLLNPEIKQQAKAIADEWKPKLASAGIDATNGNSLEADAFLQLLSTFRIASEFEQEELCKLVLVVARRRQAPELCRSLELTHKMPGIIESLINGGKQIEAVRFIHAFDLAERFPPVPLLKTYLKEFRRNSQGKGGNIGGATGQADINAQELATLKAVIRCVEEYKLEADYPLDPLQRRVAQLAKSKSDKKRTGDFNRHQQSKKHRGSGGYRGFRGGPAPGAAGGRQAPPPSFIERTSYTGMPERYPQTVPNPYNYQIPSQSVYSQPASDQRMYYYPQDDRVPTGSYDAAPSNYSNYMATGMRSSHQPYM